MRRKLSAFILFSVSACAATIYGQQTPVPERLPQRSIQRVIVGAPLAGGYLGVQMLEITKENFGKYGLSDARGVAVEKVIKDSPAARAGLQNGDVLIRFNGEEVSSVLKLTRLINETAPDHQAKIAVLRNGSESEFTVTLGRREPRALQSGGFGMENLPPMSELQRVPFPPNSAFELQGDPNTLIFRTGANRRIGVGVAALSKQLADYFGVADGKGLLVNDVRENSPAARAGIRAGDVIVEADGAQIKNEADLIRALNDKKDADIELTIVRDKNRRTIRVTPETVKGAATPFGGFGNFDNFDVQPQPFRMQPPVTPIAPLPPNQILKLAPRIL